MTKENSYSMVANEYLKWFKIADEIARKEFPSLVAETKSSDEDVRYDAELSLVERRNEHLWNMLRMLHPEVAASECDGCNCDEENENESMQREQFLADYLSKNRGN